MSENEPATEVEMWDRCPARLSPGTQRVDIISLYLSRRSQAEPTELGRLQNGTEMHLSG